MTMHHGEIMDVRPGSGDPLVEREFGVEGCCSVDELSRDRKVLIKVLRREISSGLETVTIQLQTVPSRPGKASQ